MNILSEEGEINILIGALQVKCNRLMSRPFQGENLLESIVENQLRVFHGINLSLDQKIKIVASLRVFHSLNRVFINLIAFCIREKIILLDEMVSIFNSQDYMHFINRAVIIKIPGVDRVSGKLKVDFKQVYQHDFLNHESLEPCLELVKTLNT